jgi:hypothetical protein
MECFEARIGVKVESEIDTKVQARFETRIDAEIDVGIVARVGGRIEADIETHTEEKALANGTTNEGRLWFPGA